MPVDNKIRTPDYDPENPRCDEDQLKFLKECIDEGSEGIKKWNKWRKKNCNTELWLQKANLNKDHLEGAYIGNAHLEGASFSGAYLEGAELWGGHLEGTILSGTHLQGAIFAKAHLEGADLWGTQLEGTDLREAHLEGANLTSTNLEGADLEGAHLEGADLDEVHLEEANLEKANLSRAEFSNTFLQGTNCRKAIVDSSTLIWGCKVNKRGRREKNYTDFAGVGLDSARIQPQIKQLLEYNIRKSNWSLWYNRLWSRSKLTEIISSPLIPIKWILVRPFWFISDYGRSTVHILITFLLLAMAYAIVYFYCPDCVYIYGDEAQFASFLHAVYFSVVTMTTLGFGDIAANPKSTLGLLLLMSQVIFGYVLLGGLVTRFAVLFAAGGPAGRFTSIRPKTKHLLKRISKIQKAVIGKRERIQLWCELSQEISDRKYEYWR